MSKYDYWLDLTGKEKQNKEDRYNRIMSTINSLPEVFEKLAFSEDMFIAPQSTRFEPEDTYYCFFKVFDPKGDPLANEEGFGVTGWKMAGTRAILEESDPSVVMYVNDDVSTDDNGEIILEFDVHASLELEGLYTFVCNYKNLCGATSSVVIL